MSQKNPKKIISLIISIAAHGALIYYLGTIALDYALPEGTVSSYEIDYNSPEGHQVDNVSVDVVNTAPPAPTPPAEPTPQVETPPVPVAPKKVPVAEAKPKVAAVLPKKADSAEVTPQGAMPVPVEVPESSDLATDPLPENPTADESSEVAPTVAAEPPQQEISPVPPTDAPSVEETTSQPYGRPEGVQTDTVLSPLAGNKKIPYPTMARFRKLEGETIVNYAVSAEGNVTDVTLVQSSGHTILDDTAVDTIKTWKFSPTGKDGIYERPIHFSLKGEALPSPSRLRRSKP